MKQNFKEAEANEQLKKDKEKRALVEVTSISQSELTDVMNETRNIDAILIMSLKFAIALLTLSQEIFLNQT